MTFPINPLVADLSHHNNVTSFEEAYKWGIRGIIHKATEGVSIVDDKYARNRQLAVKAGLFWGAYHFFRPGRIEAQVDFFWRVANPVDGTLLCLDHEDSRCSVLDVELFLKTLEGRTKQKLVLYSGNIIKEQLGNQVHAYMSKQRLWLAQYGSHPTVQASWDKPWLWQFTGDGVGPGPHEVPGLGKGIDISSFDGGVGELADQWAIRRDSERPVLMDEVLPRWSPPKGDITAWGQATANLLGWLPKLKVDGIHGTKTIDAIKAFQKGARMEEDGILTQVTVRRILEEIDKWNVGR